MALSPLTRRILLHCRDHAPLSVDELHTALRDVDRASIEESVLSLIEAGRLAAPVRRRELMDGPLTTIGYIRRITRRGDAALAS